MRVLGDADATVQARALDDRLFNLGFGAIPTKEKPRDPRAAIDQFVSFEELQSPSPQEIRDKVREQFGS